MTVGTSKRLYYTHADSCEMCHAARALRRLPWGPRLISHRTGVGQGQPQLLPGRWWMLRSPIGVGGCVQYACLTAFAVNSRRAVVRLEVRTPPRQGVSALVRRHAPEQQVISRDLMSVQKRMGAAKTISLDAAD